MGWKRYYGYRQTKFSADLHRHMEAWCEETGRRPPKWNRWTDGVHPKLRDAAERAVVADSVVLHDHAAHLRSSQTFAFNLFLPFREGGRERLSDRLGELLGVRLAIDRVQFEWVPPGRLLGEPTANGRTRTSRRRPWTWCCGARSRTAAARRC